MHNQIEIQSLETACGARHIHPYHDVVAGLNLPYAAFRRRSANVLATLTLAVLSSGLGFSATARASEENSCTGHLYVANSYSDNVSVIDTHANKVVATIPVGHRPAEMIFTPDQKQIYVSNSQGSSISVIDVATNSVAKTIPLDAGPLGMAFTSDGQRLITTYEPNVAKIITLATGEASPPITVGLDSEQIRITPDGKYVYMASTLNGVYVLDVDHAQIVATIPIKNPNGGILPPLPYNLLMSPDGKTVYVGATLGSFMAVIDTQSNAVVNTWPVSYPVGMQYSLDHKSLYVTNYYDATVSEYDASTGEQLRSHGTARKPSFLAVREDGKYAYFGQAYGTTMTVFNTKTWTPKKKLKVGKGANALLICNSPSP